MITYGLLGRISFARPWVISIGITIVLSLLTCCCLTKMDELDRVHYGLTKEQITRRLGPPKKVQNWIISNVETLNAFIEEADANNEAIRLAKVGDTICEYRYEKRGKTLVITFLNDNKKPVNIYTTECRGVFKSE